MSKFLKKWRVMGRAWQKWTLQCAPVNVYNQADCLGNVSSLWLVFIWRNVFYNPYFIEMLSINTDRLTFQRSFINQWMELGVKCSMDLKKIPFTVGVNQLLMLYIYFVLSSQATLMFHFQTLIWHIYMTDKLDVMKVAECVQFASISVTSLCYTVTYGFPLWTKQLRSF